MNSKREEPHHHQVAVAEPENPVGAVVVDHRLVGNHSGTAVSRHTLRKNLRFVAVPGDVDTRAVADPGTAAAVDTLAPEKTAILRHILASHTDD